MDLYEEYTIEDMKNVLKLVSCVDEKSVVGEEFLGYGFE